MREYVLAGLGLGVAIATKYTAGIVVVTLIAAALASPVAHARRAQPGAGDRADRARGSSPPTRTRCSTTRRSATGSRSRPQTAGEEGGKLGLANTSGWRYYLGTFTWGLGWLPSLFAVGGGVAMAIWQRRLALLLAPAPILLFLYLGKQSRFFARWMLPIYPILCLLAAWAVVELASRVRFVRPAIAVGVLSALVLAQGAGLQRPQRPRAGAGRHALARPRVDESRTSRPGRTSSSSRSRPTSGRCEPARRCSRPPARATAGTSGARRARASSTARRSRSGRARWSSSRTTSARPGRSWSAPRPSCR